MIRLDESRAAPVLQGAGAVLDAVPEAIVMFDDRDRVVFTNRRLEQMLGYGRGDLTGARVGDLFPFGRPDARHTLCARADGATLPVEVRRSELEATGGMYAVWTLHDESERWHAEERLAREATHDGLTGLPNRTLLLNRLDQAIRKMTRSGDKLAVLYVDVDWFKEINDEYGHAAGDEVLRQIANRLQRAVRPGDTVARFGGDEFVILCDPIRVESDAYDIGERIVRAMARPVHFRGRAITVSVSVGVGVSTGRRTTARQLLEAGDRSLYRVKRAGRGHCDRRVRPACDASGSDRAGVTIVLP